MKDNWKTFFDENKKQIQPEFQIPVGHESRFLQKLNKHNEKSKSLLNVWKVAAVLIPALMVSLYFMFELKPTANSQTTDLTHFSSELGEAENYFAYIIQEKVEEVKSLQNPENSKMIDHSLTEINNLQTQYNQLLIDLKESGGNPQVIKSIMMNLQLQIKVLENVLTQVELKKELKQTPNENIY